MNSVVLLSVLFLAAFVALGSSSPMSHQRRIEFELCVSNARDDTLLHCPPEYATSFLYRMKELCHYDHVPNLGMNGDWVMYFFCPAEHAKMVERKKIQAWVDEQDRKDLERARAANAE